MKSINFVRRIVVYVISFIAAIVFIGILYFTMGETLKDILLDADASYWPFTIQNIMWIALFFGFGELFLRWSSGTDEESQLARKYLPTDGRKLDSSTIEKIRYGIVNRKYGKEAFLPRMIQRTLDPIRQSRF